MVLGSCLSETFWYVLTNNEKSGGFWRMVNVEHACNDWTASIMITSHKVSKRLWDDSYASVLRSQRGHDQPHTRQSERWI